MFLALKLFELWIDLIRMGLVTFVSTPFCSLSLSHSVTVSHSVTRSLCHSLTLSLSHLSVCCFPFPSSFQPPLHSDGRVRQSIETDFSGFTHGLSSARLWQFLRGLLRERDFGPGKASPPLFASHLFLFCQTGRHRSLHPVLH